MYLGERLAHVRMFDGGVTLQRCDFSLVALRNGIPTGLERLHKLGPPEGNLPPAQLPLAGCCWLIQTANDDSRRAASFAKVRPRAALSMSAYTRNHSPINFETDPLSCRRYFTTAI